MRRIILILLASVGLTVGASPAAADGPIDAPSFPTWYLGGCTNGFAICWNGELVYGSPFDGRYFPVYSDSCGPGQLCVVPRITLLDSDGNIIWRTTGSDYDFLEQPPVAGSVIVTVSQGCSLTGCAEFIGPTEIGLNHITTAPEPSSALLVATGALALFASGYRKRHSLRPGKR